MPVPMRDGVVLRADVIRPAGSQAVSDAGVSHAIRKSRSPTQLHDLPACRLARLCRRHPGCPRPVRVRRRIPSVSERRTRRIRHDRVGGGTAMVQRRRRYVRLVVPRRGAMAGRRGESAASQGDGAGDDVLDAPEFLLCVGRVGHVVDRVDLGQHRARRAGEAKPSRPADRRRGGQGVERRRPGDAARAAARQRHRTARHRALLLRMAPSSAGRSLLELRGASRPSTIGHRRRY